MKIQDVDANDNPVAHPTPAPAEPLNGKAEPKPPARSLVTKLAEVMGEVGRIAKTGHNNFHNYDFATEADIAESVRGALAERHIIIMPSVEKTEWSELPTKSGSMKLCTLTVRFTVIDGDSGERLEFTMLGQGSDSGDKATYKAMTGAEKYALLKLFLIPTGDDPERDEAPPPRPQSNRPPPQPQQQSLATDSVKAISHRARVSAMWTKAKTATTLEGYREWCTKVLGTDKASADWTPDDMARLEAAMPDLLGRAK